MQGAFQIPGSAHVQSNLTWEIARTTGRKEITLKQALGLAAMRQALRSAGSLALPVSRCCLRASNSSFIFMIWCICTADLA